MTWLVQKQFIRDRAARSLSNEIGLETAYKAVAWKCFNAMFQRAEKYPDHEDHTIENLVARVKEFCVQRLKAQKSEMKFKENPGVSSIDGWPSGLRKCKYSLSRYNELRQELKEEGLIVQDCPEFFFYYTNLEEVCVEKEEVISHVILLDAIDDLLEYDKISVDYYDDYVVDYTERIIEKKFGENLSWLEAAKIVIEELNDDLNDMADDWY